MRFRLRTMLASLAVLAAIAGAARYWYDQQSAPARADQAALRSEDFRGVVARWSDLANVWLCPFRRANHLWFDDAEDFEQAAKRLNELTAVESVQVLGRQLIPHAAAFQRGEPDRIIKVWRRHPSLRQVLVDASVRGAPLGERVELYDRNDLATLQLALPEVDIIWMEVH